jgi:uncharacterized protein
VTTLLFIHSAGLQTPGQGSSRLLEALRAGLPHGLHLVAPPMPKPDAPSAEGWIEATRKALDDIAGDVVILGHSLGGSTVLQVLERHGIPETLRGVILLAAPFWSADNRNVAEYALSQGAGVALKELSPLIVLQGEEDEEIPRDHAGRYRELLPQAEIRLLPGIDHEAADAAPAVFGAIHEMLNAKV